MDLKDRVAVITGGGRGLGRAVALQMGKAGARVAVMSRSEREVHKVAEEVRASGGEGLAFTGDVSREKDISRMMEKVSAAFGGVDILVNNAAVIGPPEFLSNRSAAWKKTLDINLYGVYLCCLTAVPLMAGKGSGKIVNVSSGLGRMPFPRFCAYSVSKAGVNQLTLSLAEELRGSNIQVNALDPGVMDTSMQEKIRAMGPDLLGEELYNRFQEHKREGRFNETERVASLILFLASPASDHLTGHFGGLDHYVSLGWPSG